MFVATEGVDSQLCLLEPNKGTVTTLAGTDGAYLPFWAPDSLRVGFFAKSGLHVTRIDGGTPQKLASVSLGRGGTWSAGNEILYAANPGTWISKVDAESRRYEKVTQLNPVMSAIAFPSSWMMATFSTTSQESPMFRASGSMTSKIREARVCNSRNKTRLSRRLCLRLLELLLFLIKLTTEDSRVIRRLFVQDFSLNEMAPTGHRVLVQAVNESVMVNTAIYRAALSVAEGCLVYRTGSASGQRQLEWRDENGELVETVSGVDPWGPLNPSLSPDGRAMCWIGPTRKQETPTFSA